MKGTSHVHEIYEITKPEKWENAAGLYAYPKCHGPLCVSFMTRSTTYVYLIYDFVVIARPSFQGDRDCFTGISEKQGSWEDGRVFS